jgi:hypothetical protein
LLPTYSGAVGRPALPATLRSDIDVGGPPLSRLWDNYPLTPASWGNILGFNDGTSDGHTIEMRLWIPPRRVLMNRPPIYRPTTAPLPPLYGDGGVRRCRIPQPADLAIVRRHFPDTIDPENPNWGTIAGRLVANGHRRADLERMSPAELLALLDTTRQDSNDDDRRPDAPRLAPDEFDFGGGKVAGGFTPGDLQILRAVAPAGRSGVPLREVCAALGKKQDTKDMKATEEALRRLNERLQKASQSHPNFEFLTSTTNGTVVLEQLR